jgi:hypothetical protein
MSDGRLKETDLEQVGRPGGGQRRANLHEVVNHPSCGHCSPVGPDPWRTSRFSKKPCQSFWIRPSPHNDRCRADKRRILSGMECTRLDPVRDRLASYADGYWVRDRRSSPIRTWPPQAGSRKLESCTTTTVGEFRADHTGAHRRRRASSSLDLCFFLCCDRIEAQSGGSSGSGIHLFPRQPGKNLPVKPPGLPPILPD